MNIFASDPCPTNSAAYLDDKRVIKMILESAQMLCTAINYYGGSAPYKSTHINHPCNIWVRETKSNYIWLFAHFTSLCNQYYLRYNKFHKCQNFSQVFRDNAKLIPEGNITQFPNCTTFKSENDVHIAYKKYLAQKWHTDKRTPKWFGKERIKSNEF